jgi:sulfhydrogenase subunit beta (sulfur reductase)
LSQTVKAIREEKIADLLRAISGKGRTAVAPVEDAGIVVFRAVGPEDRLRLDALRARRSIKEFLFPMTETLFEFSHGGEAVDLSHREPDRAETVIWGCRPCDAGALAVLDAVFGDNVRDEGYFARRAKTTIVSTACEAPDGHCFCTSVGGSPVSEAGSDVLLRRQADGRFQARALTEKGEALLGEFAAFFEEPGPEADVVGAPEVPERFDLPELKGRIEAPGFFDGGVWEEVALACMGCGACAFVCPTCHCFDVVDEGDLSSGRRVRNWDSCGFGLFTKEAAGHNPRATQPARYRQRVMHKFSYLPGRYQILGCVGCGRCSALCPAGLDIAAVAARLARAEASS